MTDTTSPSAGQPLAAAAADRPAPRAGGSPPGTPPPAIEPDPGELEKLADLTGRLVSRWYGALEERPVCPTHDPLELAALLEEPLPEEGAPAEDVMRELERLVPYATGIPSPR